MVLGCERQGQDLSLSTLSEHKGLVALVLLELDVVCLKKICLYYTSPEKAFLLMLGVGLCVLNPPYVSLDTVTLLPHCTGVSLLVKEGMKDWRLIRNWAFGYNPHGTLEMSEALVLGCSNSGHRRSTKPAMLCDSS